MSVLLLMLLASYNNCAGGMKLGLHGTHLLPSSEQIVGDSPIIPPPSAPDSPPNVMPTPPRTPPPSQPSLTDACAPYGYYSMKTQCLAAFPSGCVPTGVLDSLGTVCWQSANSSAQNPPAGGLTPPNEFQQLIQNLPTAQGHPSALHLKYFGWYKDVLGSNAADALFLPETQSFSNFAFISGGNATADKEHIKKILSYRSRALVDVSFCFNSDGFSKNQPQGDWPSYSAALKPIEGALQAFYIADEPDLQALGAGIPWSNYVARLERMLASVKADFPNTPTFIIFSTGMLAPHFAGPFTIPPQLDLVGLECYKGKHDCLLGLQALKSAMAPHQRLVLVPNASTFSQPSESQLITMADDIYSLALSEPLVVGLLPFMWQDQTTENFIGARSISSVKQKYTAIGKAITRK